MWAHLRTLRAQFAEQYPSITFPATHAIIGWAIRHATWILTRHLRHADGQTSYERRWQNTYASPLCIFGETVMYAEQAKTLPKHAVRISSGIWVGRCTMPNTHLVIDGKKLYRTRTVRRCPDGPDRWDTQTMQRFEVYASTPTSIPDVPSRRREAQLRTDDIDDNQPFDEPMEEAEPPPAASSSSPDIMPEAARRGSDDSPTIEVEETTTRRRPPTTTNTQKEESTTEEQPSTRRTTQRRTRTERTNTHTHTIHTR